MATCAPSLDTPAKRPSTTLSAKWLIGAAALLMALQVELLFAKSINWDEFFHFSQIHASLRGEPVQWLQTPHVYLFGWVPALPGSPIDHILLTRLMILPFALITCLAVFDIARRFTDIQSAALAALALAAGGNAFLHAFALRADMIAAALLTGILWVLATRPRSLFWTGSAMILSGLATIATIKSVLYAPALIAIAVWRWQDRLSLKAAGGAAAIVAIAALAVLTIVPGEMLASAKGLANASLDRMFSAGLFPQGRYFMVQLVMAPVLTASVTLAIYASIKGDRRMPWWLVAGLILPLASVVIYRNAYPYFFAFILPPVAIVAALGVPAIVRRYGAMTVLGAIASTALVLSLTEPRDMLDRQRVVQSGIAEIFPEPVRYIDDIAFRPDFPRAVPHFASGWALENYHRRGKPDYSAAMQEPPAPFLFRQGYALEILEPEAGDTEALLPADAEALRQNYIEHWGRVFVAGKEIAPSERSQTISIKIAGPYTIEGAAMAINGTRYHAGSVVKLDQGLHEIGPLNGSATLRWGDNLVVPATPFPYGPLFTNY